MHRFALLLACAALLIPACRGDDDDPNNPGGQPDGSGSDDVSIYDIQSDDMAVGTPVTVRGVVVTAIDTFGGRTGGVYVQEPDGGPYSGVLVFLSGTEAADLAVGDLVDIEGGVKDEFALDSDETGRTLTEIGAAEGGAISIEKVGDGTVPEPEVVLPWELAADDAEAEKWEGVLVKVENVRVLSAPRGVSSSDDTLAEMEVTGPFAVSSSLTALPEDGDGAIARGDCYGSIVGLGDYFFTYKLLPRSADDLVAGGDCPPEEATVELCGDGEDNDYNGFADCADYGCDAEEVGGACDVETTVVDVQNETFDPASGRAQINNVTVTAISDRNGFWVQDAGGAGPYNGLYVYTREVPEGLVVGGTANLLGRIEEFNGITEMTRPVVSGIVGAGTPPTPLATTLADVTGPDAEMYESVLVSVGEADVAMAAGDMTFGQFTVSDGSDELWVDDLIFSDAEVDQTEGECLLLSGVMHYNYQDDPEHVTLLPRDADDLQACP